MLDVIGCCWLLIVICRVVWIGCGFRVRRFVVCVLCEVLCVLCVDVCWLCVVVLVWCVLFVVFCLRVLIVACCLAVVLLHEA